MFINFKGRFDMGIETWIFVAIIVLPALVMLTEK